MPLSGSKFSFVLLQLVWRWWSVVTGWVYLSLDFVKTSFPKLPRLKFQRVFWVGLLTSVIHAFLMFRSTLGGFSTLVASFLARARGSNEPELSITRVGSRPFFVYWTLIDF